MTDGERLLDTNIVVALFNGEPSVVENLRLTEAVFLSSVVLGELYFGAKSSQRVSENLARLDEFASTAAIVHVSRITAIHYGRIKTQLQKNGRPIPDNDIWIAACAIQLDLKLVTRDNHFDAVDGLQIVRW